MTKNTSFNSDTVAAAINDIILQPSFHFKTDNDTLLFALSVLDLTTLEGSDTTNTILNLCNKAMSFKEMALPNVAAVCVYPVFVRQAKKILKNTGIHVASVAGAFPSGQSPIHIKLSEIKYAIDEGADEIDMVISRGKFLQGDFDEVFDEINAIKHVCGDTHLKVILETGEIGDLNAVYDASILAIEAGADFIKTSTGKITPAATPEVSYVMLKAINQHYKKTGKMIGFKPAGGISTPDQAMIYIKLVEFIAGEQWLTPELFRIGASRLATNLTDILKK